MYVWKMKKKLKHIMGQTKEEFSDEPEPEGISKIEPEHHAVTHLY